MPHASLPFSLHPGGLTQPSPSLPAPALPFAMVCTLPSVLHQAGTESPWRTPGAVPYGGSPPRCLAAAAGTESIGTDMLEAEFITLHRLRTLGKTPHG